MAGAKKKRPLLRPPFFELLRLFATYRCLGGVRPGVALLPHDLPRAPIPPRNLGLEHPGEESSLPGQGPGSEHSASSENQQICHAEASSLLTSSLVSMRCKRMPWTFVSTEVRDPVITSRALCYRSPRGPASGVPGPVAFAPSCPTSSEQQTWIHVVCSFGATSEYRGMTLFAVTAHAPRPDVRRDDWYGRHRLLRAHSPPGDCLVAICTFLILLIQILMASTKPTDHPWERTRARCAGRWSRRLPFSAVPASVIGKANALNRTKGAPS